MKHCVTLVLITLLTLPSCGIDIKKIKNEDEKSESTDKKVKRDNRVPVEVAVIERGSIEAHIDASANLETESDVRVLSRTVNLVAELMVEEGDKVRKGDILARLENESQRIALAKARSTYEKNAQEYERQKTLVSKNLVSEKQFTDTTYTYNQSKLDRDNAQLNYDYTIIRAPIDGTVTQRLINLGDQVNNNQHLFDIVDFDTMVARIYLPEEHLPQLEVGQQAKIISQSIKDKIFNGNILRISPIVDARSGTVKVTVTMDAQGYLRPGMYVDVSLVTDKKDNAILLPKKSLVYDDEQTFVYRVSDKKVERIYIDPEIVDLDFVKPASGILEGDIVVTAGQNGLKDKARVRMINGPYAEAKNDFAVEEELVETEKESNASLDEESLVDVKPRNNAGPGNDGQRQGPKGERREGELRGEGKRNGPGGGPRGGEGLSREERRKRMMERMKNMTEEERKAFIERRKKREKQREQQNDAA